MENLKLIEQYIEHNEISNAINLIIKVEKDLIHNVEYWNLRGVLCVKTEEFESAIGCFKTALSIDKFNVDVYYNCAYAYESMRNEIMAAKYYGLAYSFSKDDGFKNELLEIYAERKELRVIFEEAIKSKLMPSVSIIIPTYNQKNFLKEALDSALEQDYSNLEIIIGDDNSTDGTKEIMNEYLNNPKIKFISREKNLGSSENGRDLLYNHCNTEYAMILNHDDYLVKKNYISKAISLFNEHPNLSLVWANCYVKKEGSLPIFESTNYRLPIVTNGLTYFINYEIGDCKHITGMVTTLFNRKKAIELKCFTEKSMSLDLFLYLKLMLVGDVGFIQEQVSVYRINKNSISYNMKLEYDYTTMDELEKLQKIAINYGFNKDSLENWMLNRLIGYFLWRINTLKSQGKVKVAQELYIEVTRRYPLVAPYLKVIN